MATAPTPGAATPAGVKKFRITISDTTLELDTTQLGPGDDLVSRQQTGFPVTGFLDQATIGADSLLILWWMARRKNGEPNLSFAEILLEFPSYQAINDANPDLTVVDTEAPEA